MGMRLVTFRARGQCRLGAEAGPWIVDLNRAGGQYFAAQGSPRAAAQAAAWLPPSMTRFLLGGDESMRAARDTVRHVEDALSRPAQAERLQRDGVIWSLGDVRLLPPVPRPPKILCVGRNYAEHAREGGSEPPEVPIFFGRFPHSLLGHGEPFVLPRASPEVDFEGELAAVIGRPAHDVPEARALDYVAGYTLFNDISIRDFQRRTSQWMIGKNFDRSGPLGPALVTRDEIPDPQDLTLTVDVSGERMQEAHTGTMVFTVAHLIAYISRALTLEPGDVLATGTPSGVGFARKPPRWLRAGDVVRVTIPRIGTLETPVVS
jgi:acylpyruvate hydrolase